MLYNVTIRLTSALLGDKRDQGVLRFCRLPEGKKLTLDGERWHWLLTTAQQTLKIPDIDLDCIHVPRPINLKKVELYRMSLRAGSGKPYTETHECLRTGAEMRMVILVAMPSPHGNGWQPTKENLTSILKFIGTHVGISPYGVNKGFGTFSVISVNENE